MEVCTNEIICVLLSVLLYCYSSTLPGYALYKDGYHPTHTVS